MPALPPLVEDGLDVTRTGLRSGLWRLVLPLPSVGLGLSLLAGRRDMYVAVRSHARVRPDRVAARDEDRSLTWAQLQDEAERVAAGLAALGVRPRQRVALVQVNRVEHLVAMAAVLELGAVPAPMSPHTPPGELAARLGGGRFAAAIVEPDLVAALAPALGPQRVVSMGEGSPLTWAGLARSAPRRRRLESRRAHGEPDLVLYTSGTTGGSKGARIDLQRARLGTPFRLLRAFDLRGGDRLFTACPVYHAAPMLLTGLCMLAGATVVLSRRFEPAAFVADVHRLGLTHAFLVPTLLSRLAASPELRRLRGSSLRALVSGGAALRPELKLRLLRGAGPVLYDFYGATELGVVSVASPRDLQRLPDSVGRVLPGVEVRLVDSEGRDVPRGARGELYVRSDLTSRYEGVDEATPPGLEGWATAGDVARLVGSQLCIVDRVKDVIVTGGVNVFPGEVEAILAGHPAVAEVAVAGVPDAEWGEAVVAFVVPVAGRHLDPEELRAFARQRLAPAQVPKRVLGCDNLPVGPTGKVLRRALVERAAEGP